MPYVRRVSKKVFLSLVVCGVLFSSSTQLKADLSSAIRLNQGVAIAELIDSVARGYKISKMTSKNDSMISTPAWINCGTSALVILAKLGLGGFSQILFTLPNMFDLMRSYKLANAAKKIAKNNQNKKNLEVNKNLLALLAIESGLSIAGKANVGFGLDKKKVKNHDKDLRKLKPARVFMGQKFYSIEQVTKLEKKHLEIISKAKQAEKALIGTTLASLIFCIIRQRKETKYLNELLQKSFTIDDNDDEENNEGEENDSTEEEVVEEEIVEEDAFDIDDL